MSDNIITITDFMDPNLDVYARLTENQLLNRANPKEGMFIAESPKAVSYTHLKNLIKTSNKQKANKQASIRRTIHE